MTFFDKIVRLVKDNDILISAHGYDELESDNITVREVVDNIVNGELIREYPDYAKGPCGLVLQWGSDGRPIHVVWGIPKGKERPAVLVTAYRPDPDIWEVDWKNKR